MNVTSCNLFTDLNDSQSETIQGGTLAFTYQNLASLGLPWLFAALTFGLPLNDQQRAELSQAAARVEAQQST